MNKHRKWTRDELILAVNLYCRTPFGKIHNRNPDIISLAEFIGRTASSVSYKLANFASIDPSLERKGAANHSKLDKNVWNEFFADWDALSYESELLRKKFESDKLDGITEIEFPDGRTRVSVVRTRINQSFFRKTILAAYDSKCCITGISVRELLVAGHIIPWSKSKKHRMNPRNGLCLNALHDKAFDTGLITLTDDRCIVLSKSLEDACVHEAERDFFLRFDNHRISTPTRFLPDSQFITYHRENIFLG